MKNINEILPNYVIWNSTEGRNTILEILEIIEKFPPYYKSRTLYYYNVTDDELTESKYKQTDNFMNLDFIIYKSDSLEDCLSIVPTIFNAKKYNI